MIKVKILGGLGNQMFQLAAAYALALQNKTSVQIDLSLYEDKTEKADFTYRHFQLDKIFKLNPDYFTLQTDASDSKRFVGRLKSKLFGQREQFYYEKSLDFDPEFAELGKDASIQGYFQSEHYFLNLNTEIRKLFTFDNSRLNAKTSKAISAIQGQTLAIHVRRGDYVNNDLINQVHGACGTEYYKSAFDQINELKNIEQVYVFSDDPTWAKENIRLHPVTSVIDWNSDDDSWQDMCLMSKCNHFIIANSSFSWWGAWLAENDDKIVYAPNKWFNDEERNSQTKDLIPSSWYKI